MANHTGSNHQPLTAEQIAERRRLANLHRQFSEELSFLENDILGASLNKLRREAAERGSAEVSEMSGNVSPIDDNTESINSDIFGLPDNDETASLRSDRMRKRSTLMRLDENSEMGPGPLAGGSLTKSRPITRRSVSRDIPEDVASTRSSASSRPTARRSVSRDLYDVDFQPMSTASSGGAGGRGGRRDDFENMRKQIKARERSMTRELDAFAAEMGFAPPSAMLPVNDRNRSMSLSRQNAALREESANRVGQNGLLPREPLRSQGRSLTSTDFQRNSLASPLSPPLSAARVFDEDPFFADMRMPIRGGAARASPALEDRGRSDWRRISVPERGKDFKSLPRKYNR